MRSEVGILPFFLGAGDGDRTRITSLEGWDSAIELHPRTSAGTRTDVAPRSIRAPPRRGTVSGQQQ